MIDFLDFELNRLFPVVSELCRMLGVRFVPGDRSNETPIGKALYSIGVFQNNGDLINRDGHYLRMRGLVENLREVERNERGILGTFRKKLTDPDQGNFFGTRFEIQVAAALARHGVRFTVRSKGGPDLMLGKPYSGLGIECASLHQVDPTKSQYAFEKLQATVRNKASKPYAVRTNALALDVTNLHAACHANGHIPPADPRNLDALVQLVNDSGFGSLLMFWWRMTVRGQHVPEMSSRYGRVDSDYTDAALEVLLNRIYSARSDGQAVRAEPENRIVPVIS